MKKKAIACVLAVASMVWLVSCKKDGETKEAPAGTAKEVTATQAGADEPKGEGHAPKGVTPGSHEDWCDEHGVAESQCTRCNPDLIAAFKATGDWCEEHGMPESQCKACNPDLKIERPAKAGAN